MNFLKAHRNFLIFLFFSVLIRLINISDSLVFTWDNGRDYFAVLQIIEGHGTLLGPTTGILGFFLGPLWFYLGIPGYLFGGTLYWFLLGYLLIGLSFSLPIFWIIGQKLFKNQKLAIFSAYLMSFVPGSVWGTIRVWNPLISIPLIGAVFLSLLKARKSRIYLGLAFFLLGLTLQSNFAYAIFYSTSLFILIPWIRTKFNIKDFLVAGFSLGITLLPQILFEIRYGYVMSKALFKAISGDGMEKITWVQHLVKRSGELWIFTKEELLFRGAGESIWLYYIFIFFIFVGFYVSINKRELIKEKTSDYAWQLIVIMAILPYIFYMVWRGNNGHFFGYYITPHFIFLTPLLLMGITKMYYLKKIRVFYRVFQVNKNIKYIVIFIMGLFGTYWYQSLYETTLKPINRAGLKSMSIAIEKIYSWVYIDQPDQDIVMVFTPHGEVVHYEAIFYSQVKKINKYPLPISLEFGKLSTMPNEDDHYWYILVEPGIQPEKKLNNWYKKVTSGGTLIRSEIVEKLKIELWVKD